MRRNFEVRISKLEEELQNEYDKESPCYGFTFPSTVTDNEIIKALNITPKEFIKWRKSKNNSGERLIFTPNWSIEKFMLQSNREDLNESQ